MGGINILIIDDSTDFSRLTKLSLQKECPGCNISEVSNGSRAITYLDAARHSPDVILLDMNMPVMDGFDFLDEYMNGDKHLRKSLIYMLTTSGTEKDIDRTQSYAFVKGYFEKPLTPENIKQILSDIERDHT